MGSQALVRPGGAAGLLISETVIPDPLRSSDDESHDGGRRRVASGQRAHSNISRIAGGLGRSTYGLHPRWGMVSGRVSGVMAGARPEQGAGAQHGRTQAIAAAPLSGHVPIEEHSLCAQAPSTIRP